jgi:hypothetical protein
MGLDVVELVLRTEEVFDVDLPDDDCEKIRNVGDLYRSILDKLALPYISSADIATNSIGIQRPLSKAPRITWSRRNSYKGRGSIC